MHPHRLRRLSLANVTVLVTHQIDAAFWRESSLFGIPGGNQANLVLNLPIIALVVHAHACVVARPSAAVVVSRMVAALGLLTVLVHSFYFTRNSAAFNQPASITLLAAALLLSTWQLWAARAHPR
jgi:hypothetical protein